MMMRTAEHLLAWIVTGAVLFAMPLVLAGCADEGQFHAEREDMTTLNFTVKGMHCQGCAASVRNAIAKVDGVESCDVSLANESAVVTAADGSVASLIMQAVADLDFTIEQN